MKNLQKKIFWGLLLLFLSPSLSYSQFGTIKIYYELKGVKVYLDEIFQGEDLDRIDTVSIGSHYIKFIKNEVLIYSDLITVIEKSETTILLKNTEEVQNRLMNDKLKKEKEIYDSKAEARRQYDLRRFDILVSKRYVTETNTTSQSRYYPGYYSNYGKSTSNSVSSTKEITDWFITQGSKRISHYEFAYIIQDQVKIENINNINKKIVRRQNVIGVIGFSIIFGGLIGGGGMMLLAYINSSAYLIPALTLVGGPLIGAIIVNFMPDKISLSYTFDDANAKIKKYNQNLKLELGLPLDYEPK